MIRSRRLHFRLFETSVLAVLFAFCAFGLSVCARADNSNVFNWTEVPQNQHVLVDHAAFDAGGYQIYDTQGETIVVPFTNHNLYAMQFARSNDGTMFFVNSNGNVPILYVPDGGFLYNATVAGARWYPFPPNYHPPHPVYLGIAPSWDAYVSMGWYPGMYCHGGYWHHSGLFIALPGLFFFIGGSNYYGWDGYRHYYHGHGGWYRPGFRDRRMYSMRSSRPFRGQRFGGSSHSFGGGNSHAFGGRGNAHQFGGNSHSFGGRNSQHFGGISHSFGGGGISHHFGGNSHTFGGGGNSHHYGGNSHTFGGGGNSHSFSGGRSHSFGGGGSHQFGSGHSFGGGRHSGGHSGFGGRSSGGGHGSGGHDHQR